MRFRYRSIKICPNGQTSYICPPLCSIASSPFNNKINENGTITSTQYKEKDFIGFASGYFNYGVDAIFAGRLT
jgi:hypothetical protein